MHARITGLGQWLPEHVRTNDAWPQDFVRVSRTSKQRELVDIEQGATCRADELTLNYMANEAQDPFFGTLERRVADATMTAPEAEAAAGLAALSDAGLSPADIDVVLCWTAVPDRVQGPSAPNVAHLVGANRAYALGVDAACASTIAQLECATALIESGRAKHVLLTQSHLMTRVFKLSHPASPTVGDAATALVVSASIEPSIKKTVARSDGALYDAVTWCRSSPQAPPWWQSGSDYHLGTRDKGAIRELIRSTVRLAAELLRELATANDSGVADFDVLATMQPRRWLPQAIVEAIDTPATAPNTFEHLAHLGGCGVVANLMAARDRGLVRPGTRVVLYAQGAGFTRASTLIHW